jgi:hypothetical protein
LQDSFDVDGARSAEYVFFLTAFTNHINSTTSYRIDGHPVLGDQSLWKPPAVWLHNVLHDTAGVNQVTLAIRSDNLHVSGFRNRFGEWIAFLGDEKKIPNSKPLSFAGGYPDLFGKNVGYAGLSHILVNKVEAVDHLRALANFRAGTRPDEHLKIPLAFFVLAVSEAARFGPIRAAVAQTWEEKAPRTIPLPTVNLVVNWAEISCALLAWDRYGRTDQVWRNNDEAKRIKRLGIANPGQALANVIPLLRGRRCSWTGGHA